MMVCYARLINRADNSVKIYAWRNDTSSSRKFIKITKKIEIGASASDSRINIRLIRLRMII
jgi:hypothetical protein